MGVRIFKVVKTGQQRVVRSVYRPELRIPAAHPRRGTLAGRTAKVASCSRVASGAAMGPRWLGLKISVVGLLVAVGTVVSAHGIAVSVTSDSPPENITGDLAWGYDERP